MQYVIVFLEGIITFISPCLLPMLPLYLSYFAGNDPEASSKKTLNNALSFVAGFTIVFMVLGAFAGSLGQILIRYSNWINGIGGFIVILLGISFLGLIKIPFFNPGDKTRLSPQGLNKRKSLLFGMVFSITWTPCIGAFLGSALILASRQGSILQGMLMLFLFAMGLAIPLIASALLINSLKSTFNFLKTHAQVISKASGVLLIIMGLLLMSGRLI
jgi:cytochrome c-type biogenesis protein